MMALGSISFATSSALAFVLQWLSANSIKFKSDAFCCFVFLTNKAFGMAALSHCATLLSEPEAKLA